jgi:hypothetical protein
MKRDKRPVFVRKDPVEQYVAYDAQTGERVPIQSIIFGPGVDIETPDGKLRKALPWDQRTEAVKTARAREKQMA